MSMADTGSRVADIGCDHGYVSIELVTRGIAEKAYAMDVRKGPLERAIAHVTERGLNDRIELRLSDGLKKLVPGEADTVIIAGMGGELITRILQEGAHVLPDIKTLILSPQSEPAMVRSFLEANGFEFVKEAFLMDEGKYYCVIKAVRARSDGKGAVSSEMEAVNTCTKAELRYGPLLLKEKNEVLKQFLKNEKRVKSEIFESLKSYETDRIKGRLAELQEDLQIIEEALYEMR